MPLIGLTQSIPAPIRPIASASGLVRGRPVIQNNTVLTAERTLMRGVTMALDGPGRPTAGNYTLNRANWQKYRDLKFNLVRLPFSVEYENNTLQQMLPDIDTAISHADATGMYVMLMLDGKYGEANYGEFERVWPTVVARYKDRTNVIIEFNNEPHWVDSFRSDEYDSMVRIYNLMRAAAPNTMIGMFTPASLGSGSNPQNSINQVRSRGMNIGTATNTFFAFHAYGTDYVRSQPQNLKAIIPCLLTETTWGGSGGVDDEIFKIGEMENLGISWAVLNTRFGEVSNADTPHSHDETSLTSRILPGVAANGISWNQDSLVSATRGLPSGKLFSNSVSFSPGIVAIRAPGAIAGKVFAITATFAKGPVAATAGTVTLPKSIALSPANPGSIQQTSPGAAVTWSTTATPQNIAGGLTWAVIKADGTQRGNATVIAAVNSNYIIAAPFVATGDKLRVWETANPSVNVDSGTVTIVTTTRSISITPLDPGTVAPNTAISTRIDTTGITNITYALVDQDWVWRNGSAQVVVNPTGDSKTVSITYTTAGQFLKVFDTNDTSYQLDAGPVKIQQVTTDPVAGGMFESFDNNNAGQLGHVWGNTSRISFSNGVVRIESVDGLNASQNACGAMEWPNGPSAGHGYGRYRLRVRMSSIIGAAALIWPADDIWPGGEEDMGEIADNGTFYMAHHWRGTSGEDRFELFPKSNHDPTQWHDYECVLKRDFLEYFVDGVSIGSTTNNVTRVFADGGVNRVLGIMCRRDNGGAWIECTEAQFTPGNP